MKWGEKKDVNVWIGTVFGTASLIGGGPTIVPVSP
jgi:hypothetical protein